jgi:hypothetical protein
MKLGEARYFVERRRRKTGLVQTALTSLQVSDSDICTYFFRMAFPPVFLCAFRNRMKYPRQSPRHSLRPCSEGAFLPKAKIGSVD